jgi:hypothetical protein
MTTFEQLTLSEFARCVEAINDEMAVLLENKRKSYGPHNLTRFGTIGIAIRASDKVERLATLLNAGNTVAADGDSIEDAWMDLIGYGILGLMYTRLQINTEAN